MIRPRTLVASPLLSIAVVAAILVGGSLFYRSSTPAPVDGTLYAKTVESPPVDRLTVAEFPMFFEGNFVWDGQSTESSQHLALDVQDINQSGELIVATGRGTYNTPAGNDIDFTFRIEANPVTGEFTMWESDPDVSTGFVTEGKHVATFVDSVDYVNARWIGDDGVHGRLTLRASETSQRIGSLDHYR